MRPATQFRSHGGTLPHWVVAYWLYRHSAHKLYRSLSQNRNTAIRAVQQEPNHLLDQFSQSWPSQVEFQALARDSQLLQSFPESSAPRLAAEGTVKRFPGQTIILTEGAEIEEVFLTLRGTVSVGLYQDASPGLWLYVSGPGAIVDTSALLDPPVSPVTVRALSDLTVMAIPRNAFVQMVEEEPAVGYQILQDYCSRLALINRVTLKEASEEIPGPSLN